MADKRIVTVDYLESEGLTKGYIHNNFANALKGNKSDTAMLLDDVSPVTHEMGVKVRGKNLIPYPYVTSSGSEINGITWTVNEDGSVTANGTAIRNSNFVVISQANPMAIVGKTVTLSGCPTGGSSTTYGIYYYDTVTSQFDYGNGVTFIPKGVVSVNIRIYGGATVNNLVFKPQIELGTTATAYTPYVPDLTAVKVIRCGKNLFDNNKLSDWGLTLSDGKYTGNVSLLNTKTLFSSFKSNTQYTISVKASNASKSSASLLIIINYTDGTAQTVIRVDSTTEKVYSFTSTANKSISNITSTYYNGDTINIAYIQIEEGTIATEYEPYKGADYTPTADGTVEGISSLYPNTTLTTDTGGVTIDCEYNRDINKFSNLTEYVKHTDIDQSYSPTSENAQRGKAVAEAVENKQDKLTAGDNITIDENNVISVTYGGLSAYTLITTDIFTEDRTGAFGYPLGGDYREVFATIKVPKGNESNVVVYDGFVLTGGTGSGAGNLLQYISIPSSVSANDVVLIFHIEVINDNLLLGTCSLSGGTSKLQIAIPPNGSNTLKHIGFTSLNQTLISGTVVSIYGRN